MATKSAQSAADIPAKDDSWLTDSKTKHGSTSPGRRTTTSVLTWAILVVMLCAIAGIAVQPGSCRDSEQCSLYLESSPFQWHFGTVCCLASLFVHQLHVMLTRYRSMSPLEGVVNDMWDAIAPTALVCSLFATVLLENWILMFDYGISTPSQAIGERGYRPVLTVTFCEWMVCMPIQIFLIGRFALKRPLAEVCPPIIMSNVYVVLMWVASFVTNDVVRWALIGVSVAFFFLSSRQTLALSRKHNEERKEEDIENDKWRLRRDLMPAFLVGSNLCYGVTYVASALGYVLPFQERVVYTVLAVAVKLSISMAFSSFEAEANLDTLIDMAVNKPFEFQRQQVTRPLPPIANGIKPLYKPPW